MQVAPLPPNEADRLRALLALDILDTPPEPALDRVVALTARLLHAPIAAISLVDADREWYKARCGTSKSQGPRDHALCAHAILNHDILIIPDLAADPRFADNPQITRDGIRFYAGAPLETADGHAIGTLCVKDLVPRSLSQADVDTLRDLASICSREFDLRRADSRARAAANDLMAAHLQLRKLADLGPAMTWITDALGKRTIVSRAWLTFTGRSADSDINAWIEQIHPEDREARIRAAAAAFKQRRAYSVRYRLRRADGEYRWVLENGVPDLARDDTLLGYFATCVDVTPAQVSDRDFLAERAAAEAAARAKSEIFANVGHELRTPLTAILGFADFLANDDLDQAARAEAVETIRRSGRTLVHTIEDMLEMSRDDADVHAECCDSFSPEKFTVELRALAEEAACGKNLAVEVCCAGDLPRIVRLDLSRLRRAVRQLISNAAKFTQSGAIQIALTRESPNDPTGSDARPRLVVSVTDSGVGIAPERVPSLMQYLHQIDASSARRFGGLGIGLALASKIARQLGGSFELAWSEPGKGSCFRLAVPYQVTAESDAIPDTAADRASVGDSALPPAEPIRDRRPRVLIAEDGNDNQLLLRHLLLRMGIDVTSAKNGRCAVDEVLECERGGRPFDAVLMDMRMPILDGYEAAARLRASGYGLPIIAVTGASQPEQIQRCLDAGCTAVLTKPIDRAELERTLQTCLGMVAAPTACHS